MVTLVEEIIMPSPSRLAAALGAAVTLSACSGQVHTQRLTDEALADTEHRIKGVVVYQPALFAEMSLRTMLVVNGKPAGSASDNPPACSPVPFEKTVMLPDIKNPYRVSYDSGLFETNQFGLSINNGMLTAVNGNSQQPPPSSSSSSPSLFSAPIPTPLGIPLNAGPGPWGAAPNLRNVASDSTLPVCTDGPVVVGYRRLVLP
jgi:hypothetical protein